MSGSKYHKIQSLYKRDPETKLKTFLEGQFSLPEFEYLQHNQWEFTEKVDGTNIRIVITPGKSVEFGGKAENSLIPAKLVTYLNQTFTENQEVLDANFPEGAVLYGEGFGAGIQKGGCYDSKHQSFILFDVRIGRWWLTRSSVNDIAEALEIAAVPVIGQGTLHDMENMARYGFKSAWVNAIPEGIVARPVVEMYSRAGNRIITKLKLKDFKTSEKSSTLPSTGST